MAKTRSDCWILYSKWNDRLEDVCTNNDGSYDIFCFERPFIPKDIIILEMVRVDMDVVERAYKYLGNKLRICVHYGQEKVKNGFNNYPIYTYQQIVNGEKNINTYSRCLEDHYDKDGDLKSLSPLEKYFATGILTTKCGIYKKERDYTKNRKYYHTARSVYDIFATIDNRRIVCGGYVNVERELLYRNGLTSTSTVYFSFVNEPRTNFGETVSHSMLLTYIIDPKYDVKGIYLSDPTADSRDLNYNSVEYAIMSYDDVKKRYPSGVYDLNVKSLYRCARGNNSECEWEINGDISIPNFDELYHRPIPDMVIVKAFIAINRFLNPNMKMAKDDSEYTAFELLDMAYKLELNSLYYDKELKERVDAEGRKMRPSELGGYSSLTIYNFLSRYWNVITDDYKLTYDIVYIENKKNPNDFKFELRAFGYHIESDLFDELAKKWPKIENVTGFVLTELSDEPFEEQLDHLIAICNELEDDYSKIASEKRENGVK